MCIRDSLEKLRPRSLRFRSLGPAMKDFPVADAVYTVAHRTRLETMQCLVKFKISNKIFYLLIYFANTLCVCLLIFWNNQVSKFTDAHSHAVASATRVAELSCGTDRRTDDRRTDPSSGFTDLY